MPPIILAILGLIQAAAPEVVAFLKKLHSDDPEKAGWTDAQWIAYGIEQGEAVASKWENYRATHPV